MHIEYGLIRSLLFLFAGSLVFSLSACGGGGGSTGGGGENYVIWTGNANGSVIVDAANHQFAVDSATRSVVSLPNAVILNGLTVDSSGVVYNNNGAVIGTVSGATSTSGSTIAEFFCSTSGAMTITTTSTSYFYSCGTGGPSGTGSTGGSGSGTGTGGGGSKGNTASFLVNETTEVNGTLTGVAPNYVSASGITLSVNTSVWAFTWAQYAASFWAVDVANATLLKNGAAFSGYALAPAGQTGLNHVTLPAGTWYVGVVPNQSINSTYTNQIYAELSAVSLSGAAEVGGVPMGTGVLNPGGWVTQPFTISTGQRTYLETEGAGGTFAVMTPAQAQNFSNAYGGGNGYNGGSYQYTYACGPTSGSPALEIECELSLPAGNYSLVYFNNTAVPSGGAGNIGFFQ